MQIFYHHPLPSKQKRVPTVMAVKQHRPWLCPLLLFVTIITVIIGGLYLWNTSVQLLRQDRQSFIKQYLKENPPQPIQPTTLENQELKLKLETVVSTAEKIDQSLSQLQEQHLDATEELNFYKHLVNSPSTKSGVVVSSFALLKITKYYIYKLVLTQQNTKTANGTVQINLIGKLNGKTKRFNMVAITEDSIPAINYKINYFQRFTGKIILPKNFMPEYLIIYLATKNNEVAEEINFKWEELQLKE